MKDQSGCRDRGDKKDCGTGIPEALKDRSAHQTQRRLLGHELDFSKQETALTKYNVGFAHGSVFYGLYTLNPPVYS